MAEPESRWSKFVASIKLSLTKQVLFLALPSGQSTTRARMLPPGAPCASFAMIVQPVIMNCGELRTETAMAYVSLLQPMKRNRPK